MGNFKVVIGTKEGKCLQKELEGANSLLNKRIGDKISGDDIGFAGYEFELTGGSDHCGFPMRRDVVGTGRKRIFAIQGVGLKKKGKGIRVRKTVCGNTIHPNIVQVNLKVLKEGSASLFEEKKAEAPKEEPKEEKKAEEVKEVPKAEEKPAEVPKKEEVKAEEPKAEEKKLKKNLLKYKVIN